MWAGLARVTILSLLLRLFKRFSAGLGRWDHPVFALYVVKDSGRPQSYSRRLCNMHLVIHGYTVAGYMVICICITVWALAIC